MDRRRGIPFPKRVPLKMVEEVLRWYQEQYFDFNVRHFHEKLSSEHDIHLSYSRVKQVARCGTGKSKRKAGQAPPAPAAATTAGNVVAHRRQSASLVLR